MPGTQQHRCALRSRNVPSHEFARRIEAETVGRVILEYAVRHEPPHGAAQGRGVRPGRSR